MKHKLYAFILIISLVFIITGCTAAENPVEAVINNTSENLNETESETISGTTETTETTEVEVTTSPVSATTETEQTAISQQSLESTTTPPPQTSESITTTETLSTTASKTIEIDLSDEEINALAIQRANEISKLFKNYLDCGINNIVLKYDFNSFRHAYISHNGEEGTRYFNKIIDDTIKTYADLYALFKHTCTPEYITCLLQYESHYYMDIDGELAIAESLNTPGAQEYEDLKYISFEIVGDKIKLNFTANSFFIKTEDGTVERLDSPMEEYSIYLENIDGEWLISNCKADSGYSCIYLHGRNWIITE